MSGGYEELSVYPGITLAQVKAWLRERLNDPEGAGARCPACTQVAKVYRRPLHASMAAQLLRFYRYVGTDWGRRPQLFSGRAEGDFAKLRYWDLIEEAAEERLDGGRAGWWRITPRGEAFTLGVARVHRYAIVYDARKLRLEGPMVNVVDCLGKRFHYNDLMGRAL